MKRANGSIFPGKQAGSAPRKTGSKEGRAVHCSSVVVGRGRKRKRGYNFRPRETFELAVTRPSGMSKISRRGRTDAPPVETKPSIPIVAPSLRPPRQGANFVSPNFSLRLENPTPRFSTETLPLRASALTNQPFGYPLIRSRLDRTPISL